MSITHDQLPPQDFPINHAIPEEHREYVRDGVERFRRLRSNQVSGLLYGVGITNDRSGNYIYLTDGGDYDYRIQRELNAIYPIEQILNTRPAPPTTHSDWTQP